MAAIFALSSALAFGIGDFLAGFAAKRVSALAVALLSKAAALVVFGVVALIVRPALPDGATLAWGVAAGLALGLGLLWYYRGLSLGKMGLVATDTAVWSALVPVVAGLLLGERPSMVAWWGIATLIAALSLVSRSDLPASSDARSGWRINIGAWRASQPGRLEGILAGIFFGLFFIGLDQTGTGNPLLPQLATVAGSIAVLGLAALLVRLPIKTGFVQWPLLVVIGVIQATGYLTFILATQTGLLSVVAVLAALSPLPTMILARLVLGQRLTRVQLVGVVAALVGIALVRSGA
jgi:drug/metabolite transporter (DMT)-like permease